MSAVVLVMGNSMADAVGGIARSYRTAFENLGHEFIEINLPNKERSIEQLNALGRTKVAFAFSFMAMGTDIMVDVPGSEGKSGDIWDVLHIPFMSLYGDSPAYFFDRHILRNPSYTALYGFPEHLEFRKRLPMINGMVDSYSPTAVDVVAKSEIDFKKKADGTIILLKNGNDPQKLIDLWGTMSPKVGGALLELASELVSRLNDKATTQIDDIVASYFKSRRVDINALPKLRLFFISMLDDYLRRVKSTFLVESLLDMPVLLNGRNWDHVDFSGRRMTYIPGGDYVNSTGMIRECLGMIDMSPNTGLAPHDRPLRAIGSHTLCLTNEQEFFTRELPHTEDYFYTYDKDSICSRVADVFANRQRYLEIGAVVAESFMKKFPAERFAQHLLDIAPFARFNQLPGVPEGTPNFFAWPPTKF